MPIQQIAYDDSKFMLWNYCHCVTHCFTLFALEIWLQMHDIYNKVSSRFYLKRLCTYYDLI